MTIEAFYLVPPRCHAFLVKLICSKNSRLKKYRSAVCVVDFPLKTVEYWKSDRSSFNGEKSRWIEWLHFWKVEISLDAVWSLKHAVLFISISISCNVKLIYNTIFEAWTLTWTPTWYDIFLMGLIPCLMWRKGSKKWAKASGILACVVIILFSWARLKHS
jgi:hypothetical protein